MRSVQILLMVRLPASSSSVNDRAAEVIAVRACISISTVCTNVSCPLRRRDIQWEIPLSSPCLVLTQTTICVVICQIDFGRTQTTFSMMIMGYFLNHLWWCAILRGVSASPDRRCQASVNSLVSGRWSARQNSTVERWLLLSAGKYLPALIHATTPQQTVSSPFAAVMAGVAIPFEMLVCIDGDASCPGRPHASERGRSHS